MKVLIAGAAGQMAQPAINYLGTLNMVSELTLADISDQKLKAIVEKNESGKCRPFKLDVRNNRRLSEALVDQDVVVNFVGPYYRFGTTVLEAAIQSGVNYVDIVDDFDTTAQLLELNDKATKAGITALIAMGFSPGVVNIVSRLSSDRMDQTEEINTYWVVGESSSEFTGALKHLFHVMGSNIPTFRDGQMKYIWPFRNDEAEMVTFPQPIGDFKVYQIGHPEPVTLSRFIPGVKKVTNRGALYPAVLNHIFKVLVNYGFTSEVPIPFRGEMVTPLEFFEALYNAQQKGQPSATGPSMQAMAVEVKGKKQNSELVHWYKYSDYSGMDETTGIPAGVGVDMILSGKVTQKGVIAPECLDPIGFLKKLRQATDVYGNILLSETVNGNLKREGRLFDEDIWHDFWKKGQ